MATEVEDKEETGIELMGNGKEVEGRLWQFENFVHLKNLTPSANAPLARTHPTLCYCLKITVGPECGKCEPI